MKSRSPHLRLVPDDENDPEVQEAIKTMTRRLEEAQNLTPDLILRVNSYPAIRESYPKAIRLAATLQDQLSELSDDMDANALEMLLALGLLASVVTTNAEEEDGEARLALAAVVSGYCSRPGVG